MAWSCSMLGPVPPLSVDQSALAKKQKDDRSRLTFQNWICIHHGSNGALPAAAIPECLSSSAVLSLKFSDAPRSIDDFLLPCIKWVTVRTNLYMEILSKSWTRFKSIAATTHNLNGFVWWMNICFHFTISCGLFCIRSGPITVLFFRVKIWHKPTTCQ